MKKRDAALKSINIDDTGIGYQRQCSKWSKHSILSASKHQLINSPGGHLFDVGVATAETIECE
jgi:hypothetical protein